LKENLMKLGDKFRSIGNSDNFTKAA